jgi:hypothetical protein
MNEEGKRARENTAAHWWTGKRAREHTAAQRWTAAWLALGVGRGYLAVCPRPLVAADMRALVRGGCRRVRPR